MSVIVDMVVIRLVIECVLGIIFFWKVGRELFGGLGGVVCVYVELCNGY